MDKRTDIRPLSHMDDGERTHLGVRQGSGKDCVMRQRNPKVYPTIIFQYMYNKQWKILMDKLLMSFSFGCCFQHKVKAEFKGF